MGLKHTVHYLLNDPEKNHCADGPEVSIVGEKERQ